MARFIVFLLLASTLVIVGMNFVVGLVRRLLGLGPATGQPKAKHSSMTVLYNHEGTTVLQGEPSSAKETETSTQ